MHKEWEGEKVCIAYSGIMGIHIYIYLYIYNWSDTDIKGLPLRWIFLMSETVLHRGELWHFLRRCFWLQLKDPIFKNVTNLKINLVIKRYKSFSHRFPVWSLKFVWVSGETQFRKVLSMLTMSSREQSELSALSMFRFRDFPNQLKFPRY